MTRKLWMFALYRHTVEGTGLILASIYTDSSYCAAYFAGERKSSMSDSCM